MNSEQAGIPGRRLPRMPASPGGKQPAHGEQPLDLNDAHQRQEKARSVTPAA